MAGPSQSPSPDVRIVGFVEGVRPKEYLPDGGRSTKPEVIDLCSDDKSSFGGDYSADEVIFCVSSDEDDSRSSINDVFLLTKTPPPSPTSRWVFGVDAVLAVSVGSGGTRNSLRRDRSGGARSVALSLGSDSLGLGIRVHQLRGSGVLDVSPGRSKVDWSTDLCCIIYIHFLTYFSNIYHFSL